MNEISHEASDKKLGEEISRFNADLAKHQEAVNATHSPIEFSVEAAVEFPAKSLLKERENRVSQRFGVLQSSVLLHRRHVEILEAMEPELQSAYAAAQKALASTEAKATKKLAAAGITVETTIAGKAGLDSAAKIQFDHSLKQGDGVLPAREAVTAAEHIVRNSHPERIRAARKEQARAESDLTAFLEQSVAV